MSNRPKGKNFYIDESNPLARGICDKTGFVFRHVDLVKQMEWRGNSLVWTGFLVGKPYEDVPNEQLRTILFPPDPVPVDMARPYRPTPIFWENQTTIWENLENASEAWPFFGWESWSGVADGYLAEPSGVNLTYLENQQDTPINYSSLNISQSPELTQQQVLNSLENFNWSNNGALS